MVEVVNREYELNLYDLCSIFNKRKRLFFVIFTVVFLVSLSAILLYPKQYKYSQAIQLAAYVDQGNIAPILDSNSVVSAIKNVYLAVVLDKYNAQHADNKVCIAQNQLLIENIGNGMINLNIFGTKKELSVYTDIFKDILVTLREETTPLVTLKGAYLENTLRSLQARLEVSISASKILLNTITNQNTIKPLNGTDSNASSALSLMFKQQLISMNENEQNSIIDLDNRINVLQRQLDSLQDTKFISDFIVSVKPLVMAKSGYLLLIAILGAILGVMGILTVEFFAKARKLDKND
jgi:hypothetical protein